MARFNWSALSARPAFFPAVACAVGAWFGASTGARGGLFLAGALLAATLALWRGPAVGGHAAVLVAMGLAAAGWAGLQSRTTVPAGLESADRVRLEGEVESLVREGARQRWMLLVARAGVGAEALAPARFRATLSGEQGPVVWPGQRVLIEARLRTGEGPSNWGEPDFFEARRRRGARFHGSFEGARTVVLSAPGFLPRWLEGTRRALATEVRRVAPSAAASQLFLTLAAGLRAELDPALEDAFARSGLSHVLSVSGLHVSALALLLLVALRWVLVRVWRGSVTFDARRLAAPLALPPLWGYVAFTGNQPPAVRSALMATLGLLALTGWRRADALNSLALAAIAVLVFDPAAVAELSMQLSFLAVLSLIVLAPALRASAPFGPLELAGLSGWRRRYRQAKEAMIQTFCASLAVTLAAAPLVACTFHRLSLAGLISNIVCLPLCALLTLVAAAGAALFVAWAPQATPLLFLGAHLSAWLVEAARLFSALPFAAPAVASFGGALACAYFLGLALFALAPGRARWLGAACPLVLAGVAVADPSPRGLDVTFLAVGQGDAAVLSSGGAHALIDAGGVPEGADTGQRFVLPFLREQRISRLSLAVLSHPHPDHALGFASTLREVPTDRLWLAAGTLEGELSEAVTRAAKGAVVQTVERGSTRWRLGEAELEVLGPPADRALLEGVNDLSAVVRVRHGEVTFLFAGDVEADGEALLGDAGPVTVLKVPHHGSATSSGEGLLRQLRPRFAVFCVGRANRFGFPAPTVVARYAALGARCYRTDRDGAIRFHSDGHNVMVETFRPSAGGCDPPGGAPSSGP